MKLGQRLIPGGVDFDSSPVYIKSDRAYFLKGIDNTWVINGGQGQNAIDLHPSESNTLYCSVPLPSGKSKVIGYFYYSEANEGYVIVYNSRGNHFIYRLQGTIGSCQIVYSFCPGFKGISNKPRYFFSEGRIDMKSLCRYLPDGSKELYKELYLVNKQVDNLRIVVEDSIATNSFTTPFFTTDNPCCGDRCRIIKSGVPTPMARIKVVPIAPVDADKLRQNNLLFKMFQFRFVDENAWGQRSEHGLISEQYFNNLAGCSRDAAGQPHCVWLETKTPCPEIVRRTVEVRSCELKNAGAGTDGNVLSDWKEAFHIDLYNQSNSALRWYERKYDTTNKEFEFFDSGRKMRIKFCNNRECKPIPLADIRNSNPAPLTSGTVASIGKGLLYGDNENNVGPFLKEDIDRIKISLTPTEACEQKYSRIKVYAVIHNWANDQNNPVYLRDGFTTFGGFGSKLFLNGNIQHEKNVGNLEKSLSEKGGHGQIFPDGVSGFRGRLAGTNFTAESVQYYWTPAGIEKAGVLTQDLATIKDIVGDNGWGRRYFIQEFDFGLVPLGTYFFRINGHNDTENLENTSTFYIHTTTINSYNQHWAITQNFQKEIFINTTAGNDFTQVGDNAPLAVIADLTDPTVHSFGSRAIRGYIYESRDNKIPVELAEVSTDKGPSVVGSGTTDHNGFYFVMNTHGSGYIGYDYRGRIDGPSNCIAGKLAETGNKIAEGTTLIPPIYLTDKITGYAASLCNRYTVTGRISECVTGAGIEGVAVVLARTNPTYTNSRGEFKVIAHYFNGRGTDQVIFSLGGSCFVLDCNCKPINVVIPVLQPVCVSCVANNVPVGGFSLKTVATRGAPHGSRQQIGMLGEDWMGRMTDIQTSEKLFVDFPTEQEQGNATYPQLIVTLPDKFSADICRRFKNITFAFSVNTNYKDWLEWAADDVEFIDSAGNKNDINPTKVKIWYRSLNGYNLLRGLNTNTTWNFYDTAGNTRLGDTVEFIKNIDGTYLPPNTIGNVQYDRQGTYFLIDYDEGLRNIKAGVKFKIKQPYICEINKTFYEVGYPINFCKDDCTPRDDEGNPVKSFVLNISTAYMLPRQIPVVKDVVTVTETTAGTAESKFKNLLLTPIANDLLNWNRDTRYTVTESKTTEVKKITVYPFGFEHHSPSDTWGDHCHNGGRVSYINPYEGKKCDRNQIMRTGSLNQANDGAVNYLHWFSLEEEYVIAEQGWGGIQALLVRDDGQVLLICEYTVFSFRTQDDRAVVDENGFIRVPIKAIFGAPERNPSYNYGCQSNDLNTIRRNDGLVVFLDSHKQAVVLHNFTEAIDLSAGIQSWLVPSIKKVQTSDAMYWHTCFDHRLKKLFLTKYDAGSTQYVNNEIQQAIGLSETMSYDFMAKQWDIAHFTPEYYGNMFGDPKDMQFFSFKDGMPWYHHNAVNPGNVYLNYFGIQCFPVIGVVTNLNGTAEKSFLSSEVYCRELLFILERLETDMGQKSQVYEDEWETGAGISYAPYLCDTANPDACNNDIAENLFDGDTLYGRWLKALYIPVPGYKGEYFSLTAIISYFVNREGGAAGGEG